MQNFFILQEVFGYQYAVNFFEPSITPLSMQRRKAQKDLLLLRKRLTEYMSRLDAQCTVAEKSFGYIHRDMRSLCDLIGKVAEYFQAKTDIL